MDEATLIRHQSLAGSGTGRQLAAPPHLTPEELLSFERCLKENIRVEQERIPLNTLPGD